MGTVDQSAPFIMIQFFLVVSLAGLPLGGTPICNTVWEEKCWDESREQCTTVQKPYTTTYYEEQECSKVAKQKTETREEQECNTVTEKQCKKISRKECNYRQN